MRALSKIASPRPLICIDIPWRTSNGFDPPWFDLTSVMVSLTANLDMSDWCQGDFRRRRLDSPPPNGEAQTKGKSASAETWENDAVAVMLYVSARLEIAANSSAGLCLHTRCLLLVVSMCFHSGFDFAVEKRELCTSHCLAFLCASSVLMIERLNLKE